MYTILFYRYIVCLCLGDWKDMNKRIFQNEATHVLVVMEKIKRTYFLWMKTRNLSFNYCYYDWWTHPLLCIGVHQ